MIHKFEQDFLAICKQIVLENKTNEQWAEIESDDMFQEGNYEGGFDATGMEFTFCIYISNIEYWFQLTLENAHKVYTNELTEIEVLKAG
jgi:hypothetical protein